MYDLVSIGDITVDLFFKGDSLTLKDHRFYLAIGGKYPASYFHESLGGGGANVAVGAAHFALNTAVLGKIGENSFKQLMIQKLTKKMVSCELLTVEKDYLNISAILLTDDGERTIIHYCPYEQHSFINERLLKQASRTKTVYMGNLPRTTVEDRRRILTFFKKKGVFIYLNLGAGDCREATSSIKNLIDCADVFILNAYEFAQLVKKKKPSINFTNNCAALIDFNDKILILTDGENGSYLYHHKKVYFQKAISPKKIVDTTGAGDAYVSGFLSSYLREKDLPKAMNQGALYAAKILEKIGAQ